MKKKIELPLTEPMYSTYHHQGPATAIGVGKSAGKIWALNNALLQQKIPDGLHNTRARRGTFFVG